ncbi:MAG: hypothetical protein ABSC25_21490 [Roseiarcus sp.]
MSLEQTPERNLTPGTGHKGVPSLRPFNRFVDLKAAGLFHSRMTLDRAIARGDFPPGRLMGNCRIWTLEEIEASLAQLPTEKLLTGMAKREDVAA